MAFSGVNFRASSGYVSDSAGHTYSLGEAYPTTRGGLTFGFGSNISSNTRDRNAGIDSRLAGIAFMSNSGSATTFTLDLPSGAGTYRVRLALGDAGASQTIYCLVKDGATTRATIGPTTTSTAECFLDTTGTQHNSAANWVSSNSTSDIVFSGSTLTLELGGTGGGSGNTAIAHVSVELVASAATSPPPFRRFNYAILNH